ncbi:hypothetical protein [Pacificibacter marinus]|uniref:Uncharacterized protein n=1 Tax=Pacificibacter marinus TaxID=658057 RepID=A0A1Y5SPQ3_9RHOB|nr:hypothetical protein [Pacificibacter marinus]SLN43795.1 hypothetical protein PAM7971_02091 [Pacificibacter marinus]
MNRDPIQNLLNRICQQSDFATKHDAFVAETLECGGSYQAQAGNTFMIDLHGIRVLANSEANAHELWLRAANIQMRRLGGAA